MGEVVIDELPPLHQQQGPLFTLRGPLARFGQHLRNEPGAGQGNVAFRQPWRVDTLIYISKALVRGTGDLMGNTRSYRLRIWAE